MDDRNNTIAGWTLAGCMAALGLSILGGMIYEGRRPEKMGYPIQGVEDSGDGAAAAEVPVETLLATADPAKGAAVFQKCGACHTITQGGPNGIGPNLYGVLGDNIAQGRGGFAFSDALKAVGGKWDFDKINIWLTNPRKFAPGTKMTFAGLGNAQDRANVIAYINTQGSNLPLPKAPAAGAAPANGVVPANGAAPANGADTAPPANAAPPGKGAAPTGPVSTPEQRAKPTTPDLPNKGTPASGAPSQNPGEK